MTTKLQTKTEKLLFAKEYYKQHNCVFTDDEYIGGNHPHNFICICGNPSKTTFSNFKKGVRCKACGLKKISERFLFTLEQIRQKYLEKGCVFLGTKYEGAHIVYPFLCSCGTIGEISYNGFKDGNRCGCGNKQRAIARRHKLEDVKKMIHQKSGVELICDEYHGIKQICKYKCICGKIHEKKIEKLLKGELCRSCGLKKSADTQRFSTEYVKDYMKQHHCEFKDPVYLGNNYKHNYICKCGRKSKIRFSSFLKGTRCSNCAKYGFKRNEPAYCYVIEGEYNGKTIQKVGVMNVNSGRLKQHNLQFKNYKLLYKFDFKTGDLAEAKEAEILSMVESKTNTLKHLKFKYGGQEETWYKNDFDITIILVR